MHSDTYNISKTKVKNITIRANILKFQHENIINIFIIYINKYKKENFNLTDVQD